jgi:enoyl-CoA hydratase/carnithine racemase
MIDLERDGAIHVVTLDNGPNTIDPAWQDRMLEVLDAVEADCDGDAGMVLTGKGKFFSSGLNVEVVMGLQGEERKRFGDSMTVMPSRPAPSWPWPATTGSCGPIGDGSASPKWMWECPSERR